MTMAVSKTVPLFLLLESFLLVHCRLIDMSFPYEKNMVTWPGFLPFNISLFYRGPVGKAPFMIAFDIILNEHTGTHIDAPLHFAEGKASVDEIPPENLIAKAIVVNISEQVTKDRDYALTVDDLKNWERKHGVIPDGCVVFVLTGLGKYWGDFDKYMGTTTKTNGSMATPDFHWPGFHKDAAQWLVDNRKIKGIGIDSRSFDPGESKSFPAHQIFLGNNIYGLESVANIEELPVKGATVYVMPMKIKGGSGGPTRIIAQTEPAGRGSRQTNSIVVIAILFLMTMLFN
ncbi:uncharacterized protein LOC114527258 [Dendronephthya gigantea]|uniref:uncharacterized protein LOC114527258 n=1 Tax=Dendronephthya gigantea TaxID=151771 RepID=UPI00106A734A|nr:uncharacterized protein LOC114527258 [Dendronephthya gigantea]